MARLSYIIDTNVIADYINGQTQVIENLLNAVRNGHTIAICPPVHYEVMRGLLKAKASRKLAIFEEQILPLLNYVPLSQQDWQKAAALWAETRNKGKQLSDPDLLIAAVVQRLAAILVSNDMDFDVLDLQRENWR